MELENIPENAEIYDETEEYIIIDNLQMMPMIVWKEKNVTRDLKHAFTQEYEPQDEPFRGRPWADVGCTEIGCRSSRAVAASAPDGCCSARSGAKPSIRSSASSTPKDLVFFRFLGPIQRTLR